MSKKTNNIIIKFDFLSEQPVGEIKKIIGLVKAKYIIPIIDNLNLESNPRSSKTGPVTDAIQNSITNDSDLFPFKTKGILLASSQYTMLDRGRVNISPQDVEIEGILDGGHNTLAIGLHILQNALNYQGLSMKRGTKTWSDFRTLWEENRDSVDAYLEYLRENPDETSLDFYVPIELLVPTDPDDFACIAAFKDSLFSICEARNNNVQLASSDKANHLGYFDSLKSLFDKKEPELSKRITWKSNEGGDIKAQDIIALTWIPLALIDPVSDDSGKIIEPAAANKIYSSKGACLKQFEKLMASPDVSVNVDGSKPELKNTEVVSAFRVAVDLPALYDYIYQELPSLYNAAGGSYGRITAVKRLNETTKDKHTPYQTRPVSTLSPDGFVTPLVYGLKALMERKEENGFGVIGWKCDPLTFLQKNLAKIVEQYADMISTCGWDPQKVGKNAQSYKTALNAYKMAQAGIL